MSTAHLPAAVARRALLLAALALSRLDAGEVAGGGPAGALDYNRDIRPILAENCFHCHGPDASRRKAKLRLDEPGEATRDLGGHAAIVPGRPAESSLVARIASSDPDELMPPPDSHRRLDAGQVATLGRWVAEGAVYRPHWAFIPPRRPALPTPPDAAWSSPIDRLVAARLAAAGLAPSPPASPETWLRRVTLDLTGLPPEPDAADAFLADWPLRGEAARAAVVDGLLASPRYGERMAQDWLDVARYADTHGFNNDSARSMWRWRDWVIEAFNANLPYDRFIRDQLAGDLLPRATVEQRLATGFARNHVINSEGGIIGEEYRVEYVADRVRTLGLAWLGLTLECARCHDHKYDPLSQRDYYRLFAFFDRVDEHGEDGRVANAAPIMPAPTRAQQARLAELDAAIAGEQAHLARLAADQPGSAGLPADPRPALAAVAATLDAAVPDQAAVDLRLDAAAPHGLHDVAAAGQAALTGGEDGMVDDALLGAVFTPGAAGVAIGKGRIDLAKPWSFAAWVRWDGGEGVLFSSMHWGTSAAAGDYGRGSEVRIRADGRIELRRAESWPAYAIQAVARDALVPDTWHHVVVTCDDSRRAAGLRLFLDGHDGGSEVLHDGLNGAPGGVPRLGADAGATPARLRGRLAGVRFWQRALAAPSIAAWSEAGLARLLARDGLAAGAGRAAWARDLALRHRDADAARHWQRLVALRAERLALERELPTAMVMAEMAAPRRTHVLSRGRYDAPADEVEPGVPAALGTPWPEGAPADRLGLARWLTRPDHPLTARVVVNRFWQQLFGAGLVRSSEDFGLQGEFPSHPELLDWLACEFVAGGWDVKALVRSLVLSATYGQQSVAGPGLRERDPDNRLLARGPRLRLSAETIRDQALAAGGLLRHRLGGPSVFPYQPADLYDGIVVDVAYPGTRWPGSPGDDGYRRSLYTFWKRTVPHPLLSILDLPDRESCSARRSATNTPLQALALMNETGLVEAGRALGLRMLREGAGGDDGCLAHGFRLVTGRQPLAGEQAALRRTLDAARAAFADDAEGAHGFIAVGAGRAGDCVPDDELAAWAALGGLLLNLDEATTRD